MNDFTFCCPTAFVFGRGVTERTGAELAARGHERALVVYGQGSVVRTGTLARILASLDEAGVAHAELGGARPNPEVGHVREGIAAARALGADIILAVGGGSAIDTAKAVSAGVPLDVDVWELFARRAEPRSQGKPAVACVLTIPAAGSEASNSAVISNDELCLKRGLTTELNRPELAIMDPELTYTLPPAQTAAGVCDMMVHVMERYFSSEGPVPVTDNIACGLIRALVEAGPVALADPTDYDARATIMWAGTLAHNDLAGLGRNARPFTRAGGWESHALEHELSAHDPRVTHGAGLAVIFPAWLRYVWPAHPERILSFGREVWGIEPAGAAADVAAMAPEQAAADPTVREAALATIDELQTFFVRLGLPRTLGELGVRAEDVPALLATLEQNKGTHIGDFQPLSLDDCRAIYESAL